MKELRKIWIRVLVLVVFLLAANQVYRIFFLEGDLQEHSDLVNLIREIPDSASVVYFGESSNFTFGDYDLNTKRISDLISEYYPDVTLGTVSHGALHAGNYKILMKQIPEDSPVNTVIVTLNLRSFNSSWIDSKLETSLAKSMVMLGKKPPMLNRSLLSFKAYDIKSDDERVKRVSKHWEKDEVFLESRGQMTTVDKWTEEILGRPDSVMARPKRLLGMHYIRTYAFEIDTTKNKRIKNFDEIVRIADKRGWNLVFNLLAENTEKANELIGPDLLRIMRNNALLLSTRYSEMGVTVVNNLESVRSPSYLDQDWTTEHYDDTGRKIIAKNVAAGLKDLFPGQYQEVVYNDREVKSTFSNDGEGKERWFQMESLSREQAYSGNYSSKINRENAYSLGFTRPLDMIPQDKLNAVDVEFQYFQPLQKSVAQVVLEILGGEGKSVWMNYHIKDSNPVIGKWNSINTTLNIPNNIQSLKLVKVYVWNPGKEPVFIDDIVIQFK